MAQSDGTGRKRPLRRLLTPSLYLENIYDLPFEWLYDNSIKAVITDLDNTLVPWRDYRVADELSGWFNNLHKEGFKTLILTNARPAPTITELSTILNTRLVVGARKPISRFFREALKLLNSKPGETCVIGDQIFTDILGGNIIGCHTVLVEKLGRKEFAGTRVVRLIERIVRQYVDLPHRSRHEQKD